MCHRCRDCVCGAYLRIACPGQRSVVSPDDARRTRPHAGADKLADRLHEPVLAYDSKLLALSLDQRAVLLAVLDDPPAGLAELRAVLSADHQWRRREGLD